MSHAFRAESAPAAPRFSVNKNAPLGEQAREIRANLENLGLGYSCLALYLSSRIDILPAEFCREFAFAADVSPPLPASEVQHTLEEEISAASKGTIADFSPDPIRSTLLTHSYAARLANGEQVVMTILRPECSGLRGGPEIPPSFDKGIVQEFCGSRVNDAVFYDFFSSLRRKCDFIGQLDTQQLMVQDAGSCELLRTRRIYRELCTSRIFTSAQVDGLPIDEVSRNHACNTDVLARNLCHVWLHQVLQGSAFVVDPLPHNISLVENGTLFTGCDFVGLSATTKENLWNYFMATMVDDPDRAAMYLLREMEPPKRATLDSETFRSKFRQSAYFGALEPLLGTNSNTLPQLIFQHWKTALEYGYRPMPDLLCFYRGLFSIARIAQRLCPFGDPLREGVEETRSDRIMGQVKEIVDWRYWFQNSDKFANALVSLPKIMDEALTRASAPSQSAPTLDDRSQAKRTSGTDITIIFVFAMVLLVVQSASTNPLTEKLVLLLVLLAGLMALRKFGD